MTNAVVGAGLIVSLGAALGIFLAAWWEQRNGGDGDGYA